MKPRRKTVYLPPGIYGAGMMEVLFPSSEYRVIIKENLTKKQKRNKK
jgi:hypothetical protein